MMRATVAALLGGLVVSVVLMPESLAADRPGLSQKDARLVRELVARFPKVVSIVDGLAARHEKGRVAVEKALQKHSLGLSGTFNIEGKRELLVNGVSCTYEPRRHGINDSPYRRTAGEATLRFSLGGYNFKVPLFRNRILGEVEMTDASLTKSASIYAGGSRVRVKVGVERIEFKTDQTNPSDVTLGFRTQGQRVQKGLAALWQAANQPY